MVSRATGFGRPSQSLESQPPDRLSSISTMGLMVGPVVVSGPVSPAVSSGAENALRKGVFRKWVPK